MQSSNRSPSKDKPKDKTEPALLPANMRTGLQRFQKCSLFSPRQAAGPAAVSHLRVKPRNLIGYSRSAARILLPVCMDRTNGNSLFNPANLGKILVMLEHKFQQLDITILLTDEIYAFNLQRVALSEDKILALDEARKYSRDHAVSYTKEIEPFIKEFISSKAGHKVTLKHLSEYTSLQIPAKLYLHFTDKYNTDRKFRRVIDKALSRFFIRQAEQGETNTYDEAKAFNLQYLLVELSTIIYIYSFCRDEIDHHIYECDDLSAELTEAVIGASKDFLLSKYGIKINSMDEFFLEFKFDEFDTMKANTKQHMDDELALLDKFKTHYDPASEDTKDYLESCKARNITLSGDLRDRVPMIARMFNPDIQDDTSLMEKFKLHLTQSEEDLPALKDSTPCFVIPHVSLRVNFLIGCNDYNRDSLIFGDICDVIISSFLVMHYFDIGDSSSIHRFQHIFKGRFNNHKEFNGLGDYGHVQSMVAFTSGTSVSLKALFLFDQYREELGVSNVLYFGMYSEDVKRLQSESIKHRIESVHNKGDFPIESSDRQMNIKPMNAKDKFKQFQKFMCKWYQDQTDAHEECSNSWKDKKYKYL